MITLVKAARRYACPTCDAPVGEPCDKGKVCRLRLNLASGDKDVIHMAVESMLHSGVSRGWKDCS